MFNIAAVEVKALNLFCICGGVGLGVIIQCILDVVKHK
jgi:hypothetical protein